MQALLLATGEGNKLFPLTTYTTSPMLPLANRPVMAYPLELLARYGCNHTLVSLYHLGGSIESYFGNGQRWNMVLTYLLQRQARGTAGAIKRAGRLLTETFLVLPADAILDLDIDAALAYHRAHNGQATVILSRSYVEGIPLSQCIQVNAEGQILVDAMPAMSDRFYFYTGAYIFEPSILDYIPAQTSYACDQDLVPALMALGENVYGYVSDGYWNPLACFQDYQDAQHAMLASATAIAQQTGQPMIRYPYLNGRQLAPGLWCGQNSVIHASARLTPPVYIGSGSRIARNAEIGPDVVLGANTIVDEGATIQNSTIISNTYIGKLTAIDQRVVDQTLLIDIQTAESVQIPDPLLLAEANPGMVNQLLYRLFIWLFALILFIFWAPLMLFVGVTLWITSIRPVLRREHCLGTKPASGIARLTTEPQMIELYRFRVRRDDGRSSRLGQWLERWELHRLPELWNVLCGDIGLIGVMPLSLEVVGQVTEEWQRKRYSYQAGLTGLWYTETTRESTFDEICVADAYHAAFHTWRTDLRLLGRTPVAWLRRTRRLRPVQQVFVANQPRHYGEGEFYNCTDTNSRIRTGQTTVQIDTTTPTVEGEGML